MKIGEKLDAAREEITKAYLDGESTCELGRKYGCSNAAVYLRLRKWGVEIRPTKVMDRNREEILRLHAEGHSATVIGKMLGIGDSSVCRCLKAAGIDISGRRKVRDDSLEPFKEEIMARYASGEGVDKIAQSYGRAGSLVNSSLRRWGVQIRSVRDYAYPVNEHFFDVIDDEDKAYIFGFWMADGSNENTIGRTSFLVTDFDIIQVIAQKIGWGGPIQKIKPQKPTHKTRYRIVIGSRHMSDALLRLGCVERKTYHGKFPSDEQVPPHLHRHLLRGWSDGNGHISIPTKRRATKGACYADIVGTKDVCEGIAACVERHTGVKGRVSVALAGEDHTTWKCLFRGRIFLQTYLDWLYQDATICLERKRLKYQAFLNAR